MQQPNPWVLFMGGLMLFQVAAMIWAQKVPEWLRIMGVSICVVCGIMSVILGLQKQFGKKPQAPPKVLLKRERIAEEAKKRSSAKDAN